MGKAENYEDAWWEGSEQVKILLALTLKDIGYLRVLAPYLGVCFTVTYR